MYINDYEMHQMSTNNKATNAQNFVDFTAKLMASQYRSRREI